MKCIIAGSRRLPNYHLNNWKDWHDNNLRKPVYNLLEELIKESQFEITTVISGTCWGMDQLGEEWARNNAIEIESYPADWKLFGKSAGFRRNETMAEAGDCLICIHTKDSRGSENMIQLMKNKPSIVKVI
jgi:hypothetical protein